jgi:hypothetical protein
MTHSPHIQFISSGGLSCTAEYAVFGDRYTTRRHPAEWLHSWVTVPVWNYRNDLDFQKQVNGTLGTISRGTRPVPPEVMKIFRDEHEFQRERYGKERDRQLAIDPSRADIWTAWDEPLLVPATFDMATLSWIPEEPRAPVYEEQLAILIANASTSDRIAA